MARMKVIVNPTAGAGKTAREWPQIMDMLKSLGLDFEYDLTEAPGHAIELAKSGAKNDCELIVSVGGDGTIHEVVNGLYDGGATGNIALGIVSTGTGSDYIRTIGIYDTYKESCQCFTNPGKRTVDLGVVEYASNGQMRKRLFVNFAGLGFDAEIVRATTQEFKAMGSTASYLMGLVTTLMLYRNKEISLTLDGEEEKRKVCTVMMSNGKYGGGGMLTAPDADPEDGLFDVLIVGDLIKPDLLRSLPRIYKGTHLTHPKVTVKRAREVEIKPAQQMAVQADGELLGESPARFSILPAALTLAI